MFKKGKKLSPKTITHKFSGEKSGNSILLKGTCDVNIWYSCENDTKTLVSKQTINYEEIVNVTRKRKSELSDNEEIIVRSLKQPSCIKADIVNDKIEYDIEKELGIEILGETMIRIPIENDEDDWEEIIDERSIDEEIDSSVKEDFLN